MMTTVTRNLPALGFDPTPGSVSETRDLARTLGDMTSEIGTILSNVNGAGRGSWQGKSANAFMDHLKSDLQPAIQKCHDSFDQASSLLYRWADQLDGFQNEANALERQAETQQAAVNSAQATVNAAANQPSPSPGPSPTPPAPGSPQATQDAKNHQALTDARHAMTDIINKAHDLHDRFIAAAKTIADQLHHAGQMAPGKPGLFDSIVDGIGDAFSGAWHWVEAHANAINFIGDMLSDLSGILGILAIICLPFEPLGAIFGAAAAITSGAALLTHLLAKAAGANVSWVTIGTDALGALPGIGMFGKAVKVADTVDVAARAGKLSDAFGHEIKVARNIFTLGKEGVEGGLQFKMFGKWGKDIALFGKSTTNFITHEGGVLSRAQGALERGYSAGQWLGTRGLNTILKDTKYVLDPHTNLGRAIDGGIKLLPKLYFMPHGIKKDLQEMHIGDPFHAMFA